MNALFITTLVGLGVGVWDVAGLEQCRAKCAAEAVRCGSSECGVPAGLNCSTQQDPACGRKPAFDACREQCWARRSVSLVDAPQWRRAELELQKVSGEVELTQAVLELEGRAAWGDPAPAGCRFWEEAACKRECQAGKVRACGHVARRAPREEARAILAEVCKRGDAYSCAALSKLAQDRSFALKAVALGRRGCEARDGRACLAAAIGSDVLGRSDWRASYGSLGCALGEAEACTEYLQSGQRAPEEQVSVSTRYAGLASQRCQAGDDWQCWLYAMYRKSSHDRPEYIDDAASVFATLCAKGSVEACAKQTESQGLAADLRALIARQQREDAELMRREQAERDRQQRMLDEARDARRRWEQQQDELDRQNQQRVLDELNADRQREREDLQRAEAQARERQQRDADALSRRLEQQRQQQLDQVRRAAELQQERARRDRELAQQRAEAKARADADARDRREAAAKEARDAKAAADLAARQAREQREREAEERRQAEADRKRLEKERLDRERAEARARADAEAREREAKRLAAQQAVNDQRLLDQKRKEQQREEEQRKAKELLDARHAEQVRKAKEIKTESFRLEVGGLKVLNGMELSWRADPMGGDCTVGNPGMTSNNYSIVATLKNRSGVRKRGTLAATYVVHTGGAVIGSVHRPPAGLRYLDPGEVIELVGELTCIHDGGPTTFYGNFTVGED